MCPWLIDLSIGRPNTWKDVVPNFRWKKGDGDLDEAILDDGSISCMSKDNKDKIENEVAV
jgi:hypothetical protein